MNFSSRLSYLISLSTPSRDTSWYYQKGFSCKNGQLNVIPLVLNFYCEKLITIKSGPYLGKLSIILISNNFGLHSFSLSDLFFSQY